MSPSQLNVLRTVFERMTGLNTATVALSEAQTFYANADSFSSPRLENGGWWQNVVWYASFSTSFHFNWCINLETDAMFISFLAAWWQMFGYSTLALQKLAIRLVSQCASATRCERNWSTFACIHTKVRNRLTYEKLHKLVYVNYNIRIQNSIDGGSPYHDEDDPFNRLMELTLVDASSPIHEWMKRARSTVQPELDEESLETDAPIPSSIVTATADPRDLQRRAGSQSVSQWVRKNISDSHKGKRKTNAIRQKGKSQDWSEDQSDLMQLQKMKIAQPNKNLMIAAEELLMIMVMMEMTLVVVPSHLPHKVEVMSDLSLPSWPICSHTATRMKTTASRHHQEFQ
jgi:hypothetical protein